MKRSNNSFEPLAPFFSLVPSTVVLLWFLLMLTSIVFQNVSWLCSRRGRIAFFCCLLLFARVFLLSLLELVGFVQSIQCSTVRTCVYCIYPTLSTRLTCSFLLMVSPRVTEHLVLLFCEFTTECTPQTPFQCDSLLAHQQVRYWF